MTLSLQIVKSEVANTIPTIADIKPGGLAINIVDQKLYSANATHVFELVGSGNSAPSGDIDGGTF